MGRKRKKKKKPKLTDQQIADLALERWGKRRPTFDDVIMEHTPDYQTNRHHRERWHRIKDLACAHFTKPTCEWCGGILTGKPHGHRKYCGYACNKAASDARQLAG